MTEAANSANVAAMLPLAAIPFPDIDPVAFSIGPVDVRWYSLAYIVGLLFAVWYAKRLIARTDLWAPDKPDAKPAAIDDLLLWAAIGVVVGGRLGEVLFYQPGMLVRDPVEIFKVWHGGMSFHGGFLGVIIAVWLFARRHKVRFLQLLDLAAITVPVGIGLGRLANFIKGELFGRVSDVPWAMVFPHGGPNPRHPSQLYEFALEGALLFAILVIAVHRYKVLAHAGFASGIFGIGYALARITSEAFRQPDGVVAFTGGWLTFGMAYSLPVLVAGSWLIWQARTAKTPR